MTTTFELLFHNTFTIISLFQKYDEDGYPIEDDSDELDEDEENEEEGFDNDDGFDTEDDLEENSWE